MGLLGSVPAKLLTQIWEAPCRDFRPRMGVRIQRRPPWCHGSIRPMNHKKSQLGLGSLYLKDPHREIACPLRSTEKALLCVPPLVEVHPVMMHEGYISVVALCLWKSLPPKVMLSPFLLLVMTEDFFPFSFWGQIFVNYGVGCFAVHILIWYCLHGNIWLVLPAIASFCVIFHLFYCAIF